jgi:hypothetical protein
MRDSIDKLRRIYKEQVLSGRTRDVRLLGRKCEARMLRTFLGIEVKLGNRRITCPDLSTARYVKLFGELGIPSIRLPYDPTRTARLLPELESAVQTILDELRAGEPQKLKAARTFKEIRRQLRLAEEGKTGPGPDPDHRPQ